MSEPVNLFTLTSFFRKEPLRVKKGLNAYNSNRVINVNVLPGGIIKGKIQASMKKKVYQVEVHVESQKVSYSTCECPIGKDKCHHMAALLIWVEKNVSRTDVECVWKRVKTPKSDDIVAKRVSVMAPSTSQAGIKTPVTQEVKDWTLSSLSQLGRFTGMWWILSPETPQTLPIKTWDGFVTSPGFTEAEDKALYVLSSLAVTDTEKQQIERDTVFQAKNDLWMAYRKKRITASNFGLVLAAVKRKRYPPSLFKNLLGQYNFKEGSQACDWGITHEPTAKQDYTEKTGVVVQERGVFLSNSGLLGGSPDGTVSDECIIEVKCPWSTKNMTVRQAAAEKSDFFLQLDAATDSLTLKPTHPYWHQIQGNLHLTGASTCHLVVWTLADLVIVPVLKDPTWAGNIDILETFYKDCFLPKILSEL